MLQDIGRRFSEFITPIKGTIMLAIIALISALITAYISFDSLSGIFPLPVVTAVSSLLAIAAFLLTALIGVTTHRIIDGPDIEFPEKASKRKFDAMYREDDDIVEIPILLPIKNRDRHKEILCYAVLEKFDIVCNSKIVLIDDITKQLLAGHLIRSRVPHLRWLEHDQANSDCEIRIPPQQKRNIEVARFQFLLKQSLEENHARASIGLHYCKSPDHIRTQLGLYEVRITILYQKNSRDWITKYFNGYLYANVVEHSIAWKLGEDDIRNRLEGEVIIGSGSWEKNKDVPQPKSRYDHAT